MNKNLLKPLNAASTSFYPFLMTWPTPASVSCPSPYCSSSLQLTPHRNMLAVTFFINAFYSLMHIEHFRHFLVSPSINSLILVDFHLLLSFLSASSLADSLKNIRDTQFFSAACHLPCNFSSYFKATITRVTITSVRRNPPMVSSCQRGA